MEPDYDLIQDEREHQYRVRLQRRMATCGDSTYPQYLAQQDILSQEGIVDISEGEQE